MELQEQNSILVVVGLGNPGLRYQNTRHNIGFISAQSLAKRVNISLKLEARWPGISGKSSQLHILMPTTYMNESGLAVKQYLAYYKLSPAHLLVVYDDVDLDFGTLRLRPGGGSGGHNGLKSISHHLATCQYSRLRMGIGERKGDLADYVLSPFSDTEQLQLSAFVKSSVDVVEDLTSSNLQAVMKKINSKTE